MIVSIVLPAVGILLGVLLAALSIVLLRGKRLSGRWGVSLLVCALLLAGSGGTALVKQIQSRDAQYGSIYLALCYLEDGSTDPAALYLKRVEDSEGYYFLAAQTLLEQARGALARQGVTPVYLVTEHTSFYERYGWEFLGMVQEDGGEGMLRIYRR